LGLLKKWRYLVFLCEYGKFSFCFELLVPIP
jgi:hypothetical protein